MEATHATRRSSGAGGTGTKILVGCGCGCLAIVVLVAALGFVIYRTLVRPGMEVAQRMGASQAEAQETRAELLRLDEAHGVRLGADAALASVTDEDVTRYLAIRVALASHLAASEAARLAAAQAPADPGAAPVRAIFGAVKGFTRGLVASMEAHAALTKEASRALAEQSLGPTDLATLAEIVEWRFLHREDAVVLGLPAFRRADFAVEQATLHWVEFARSLPQQSEKDSKDLDAMVQRTATRLAALREEAEGRRGVADATRAVLEARRAEIEAGPASGVGFLATLLSEAPPFAVPGAAAVGPGDWEGAWKDESEAEDDAGRTGTSEAQP